MQRIASPTPRIPPWRGMRGVRRLRRDVASMWSSQFVAQRHTSEHLVLLTRQPMRTAEADLRRAYSTPQIMQRVASNDASKQTERFFHARMRCDTHVGHVHADAPVYVGDSDRVGRGVQSKAAHRLAGTRLIRCLDPTNMCNFVDFLGKVCKLQLAQQKSAGHFHGHGPPTSTPW